MPSEQCPVCGGPYDHSKKVWSSDPKETLRSDATACSRKIDGMKGQKVWVHLPDNADTGSER